MLLNLIASIIIVIARVPVSYGAIVLSKSALYACVQNGSQVMHG